MSLKHPFILVTRDFSLVLLVLPTLRVRGFLPCLVEIDDLLLGLSCNLKYYGEIFITKISKLMKFFP